MDPIIDIRHLKKAFGDNLVLNDVNLRVETGENLVVMGRSGSGKSVLIKCIVGLVEPDAGDILVFGKNIPDLSHEELDSVRTRIGFLFQSSALYDSMTVRENLEFPLRRHRRNKTKSEIDESVAEALENVGLLHAIDLMPAELSGGMRKRIGLARTIILKPDIILYDEPTSGLDPITAKEISLLINQIQQKYNTTALIITHDLVCARLTANRVVVLLDGMCVNQGSFDDIQRMSDARIHSFFE